MMNYLLPIAPPGADLATVANAIRIANIAYAMALKRPCQTPVPIDTPIVSTAHLPLGKGQTISAALVRAGYVKLGRARNGYPGYTTIYVRSDLVGNYASPTAAFKEFQQCVKS